jgi:ankyrin repeat protein
MKRNEFSNNIEDTKKSLEDNFIKKYSKILHYIISYDGIKLNESLEDESELSKINVKCPKGLTALHYAIKYRDSDLCYKLLSIKSIDINLADNNGITPFYMATENDLEGVALTLLCRGANIESVNPEIIESPLILALFNNNEFLSKIYLLLGVDSKRLSLSGYTPMMIAAKNGFTDIVSILLSKGEDVNLFHDKFKETALHLAVKNGHFDVVKLLVDNQADVNLRTFDDDLALQIAIKINRLDIALFLIKNNSNIKFDYDEKSPLDLAILKNHHEMIDPLIKAGIDVNSTNYLGNSPLFTATSKNDLLAVKLLLNNGADINMLNSDNETILHEAVRNGSIEMVKLLLNHKIDFNIHNKDNYSALDFAIVTECKPIVEILLKIGASVSASILEILPYLFDEKIEKTPNSVVRLRDSNRRKDYEYVYL